MDGIATVAFMDNEPFDADELIATVTDVFKQAGVDFEANDALIDHDTHNGDEKLERNILLDETMMSVCIYFGSKGTIPNPYLMLTTDQQHLVEDKETGNSGVKYDFFSDFIGLVHELASKLDPLFVSSFSTAHVTAGPAPELVTPSELPVDLERIPWLGIYSDPLIETFGGRERVLDTPAWHVDELENGSILIITTKIPWADYNSKMPADRYLLDGDDQAGQHSEA